MEKCEVVDECVDGFSRAKVHMQRSMRLIEKMGKSFDEGAKAGMVGRLQHLVLKSKLKIAEGFVAQGLVVMCELHKECDEIACDHGVGVTEPPKDAGDLEVVVMGGAR